MADIYSKTAGIIVQVGVGRTVAGIGGLAVALGLTPTWPWLANPAGILGVGTATGMTPIVAGIGGLAVALGPIANVAMAGGMMG